MTALRDPAADVVASLVTAGHGTAGTDIFKGGPGAPARGVPPKCIFVTETEGPAPMPIMGQVTGTRTSIYNPHVQVVVRGDPRDRAGPRTIARAILKTLQTNAPTGWTSCMALSSSPGPGVPDANVCYEYFLNFELSAVQ